VSLQDLVTTKTPEEMLADELTLAESEGLATTTWQSGSVIRTILVIMAHMFSVFSGIIVEPILGGFGDLVSSIEWARIWAKQMFDVDAITAEAATGYITAVNTKATQYDLAAGELIVAHATTGKLYRNSEAISILANATTADLAFAAVEVGTSSNASPGTITVIVGPALDGVTITNPASVLGTDDETVKALVDRARGSLAATSPDGPKEAYNYVAKTPEYSDTATAITRATTICDAATGAVTVYIATAGGAPDADDVAIVQSAIDEWAEPWCTTATAVAVSTETVAITYQVWVTSSLTELAIKTAIDAALAEYFASLAIGGLVIPPAATGSVYVSALRAVITSAKVGTTSIGASLCEVTLPTADVALAADEVAVLGTITGTVIRL